jgi:hypothetical protein
MELIRKRSEVQVLSGPQFRRYPLAAALWPGSQTVSQTMLGVRW